MSKNNIVLTPNEATFGMALRIIDIHLSFANIKAAYNLVLAIEQKSSQITIKEIVDISQSCESKPSK